VTLLVLVALNEYIVTGRASFTCTFDETGSCLLIGDDKNSKEMWESDDGRGLVNDNSLNIGLLMCIVLLNIFI